MARQAQDDLFNAAGVPCLAFPCLALPLPCLALSSHSLSWPWSWCWYWPVTVVGDNVVPARGFLREGRFPGMQLLLEEDVESVRGHIIMVSGGGGYIPELLGFRRFFFHVTFGYSCLPKLRLKPLIIPSHW